MGWWSWLWWGEGKERDNLANEGWDTLMEVRKAQLEWENAYLMFDESLGQDQIDYAIYMLEAAERKYQIHLKHAKAIRSNSSQM